MRVECESCHAVADATFAIEGGTIAVTCSKCSVRVKVDPDTVTVTAKPDSAPASERCPKCGRARAGERACPSCGLAAARMQTFAGSRDAGVSPGLLAAWERVEADWSDRAAHDEVFERTTACGAFAWTAGRYREAQREKPATDDVAKTALERLRRAAEATMMATAAARAGKETSPYKNTVAIMVVIVLALVGLLIYQFVRSSQLPDTAGDDPPAGQVR